MSQYSVVLAIQNTTLIDLTHHPKTTGLGPIGAESHNRSGFVKHTTLAVSETGLPLGVLTDSIWARDVEKLGQAANRKDRPISEKESYKWIHSLANTKKLSPQETRVIHICDREADIYEFLVQADRLSAEYVIRATQDRRIEDSFLKLRGKVANQPVAGTLRVSSQRGITDRHAQPLSISTSLKGPFVRPNVRSQWLLTHYRK